MLSLRSRWLVLVAMWLGLVLLLPTRARASTFEVNPIRVSLSPTVTSRLLTVRNQSAEVLRFQVTAFAWTQSTTGEIQLTPTKDLVIFPVLFSMSPGEARNLRVGTTTSFGATEKSYRIFVEELPPPDKQQGGQSTIRVLTKMGIPVFLEPSSAKAVPRIDALRLKDHKLSFSLLNVGTAHFMGLKVSTYAKRADGSRLFERSLPAWYVLAGGTRTYDVDLPADVCLTTGVSVDVETDKGLVSASLKPDEACGQK